MAADTQLYIFGVEHDDENVEQKIKQNLPERVDRVYHEGLNRDDRDPLDMILWRPLQFVYLLPLAADIPVEPPDSECEKAAIALAKENDAELHYIGMPRKDRSAAVGYLSTVAEWLWILGVVLAVLFFYLSGGLLATILPAFVGFTFSLGHAKWWNVVEYPVRELNQANHILNNAPSPDEVGVAVVGNTHRKPVAEQLESLNVTTEDVTP